MAGLLSPDFLTGATVATMLLLVMNQLYKIYVGWVKAAGSDRNPQTVVHKTSKTPSQVVTGARRARFKLLLVWITVFVAPAFVMGEYLSPGIVRDTLALLLRLILVFLDGLVMLLQQVYRFLV